MPFHHFSHTFETVTSQLASVGHQIVGLNVFNGAQCRSTRHGVFFMGIMTQGAVTGHIQVLTGYEGGQWKDPAAQTLAYDEHIRYHAKVLTGKHLTSATEGVRYLVEDELCAMTITSVTDDLPVFGPGDVRSTPDWFCNDGSNVTLLFEDMLYVLGTRQVAAASISTAKRSTILVWRRSMLGVGKQWTYVLAKERLATD